MRFFRILGCGRLEEPLGRYGVNMVVHGHAHKALPKAGLNDVPVYNVALPLIGNYAAESFPILDV